MALEPEGYEFDCPDLELVERKRAIGNRSPEESNLLLGKGKSKLLEETAESSFEKGEPSQGDDDPQQDESCFDWYLRRERPVLSHPFAFLFSSGWDTSTTHVLNQMEMHIIQKRKQKIRNEKICWSGVWVEMVERLERSRDEIAISVEVKSDFARVENMLNCLNPKFVKNLVETGYHRYIGNISKREAYLKAKSEVPHRLSYYRHEIKTTAELLEKLLKEVDDNERLTEDWRYKELRKLSHYLLNLIEKWDSTLLEKKAESSGAQVEPQSKGVVSKRNALRKQHNSQRDDPEELFPDLVELETILEDCLFKFPQHPSFITAVGYTPILVV